eukprot:TRINITY_DN91420_c0_g1_i1.p4 TRINITY_DN91420_c0_g1~~TRINITY_DN91420_c0_g1_i1.p4  ORF type:complete len:101 (-),score=21.41 TRINITY_DN91420_c0_g1_i1:694-996(-)
MAWLTVARSTLLRILLFAVPPLVLVMIAVQMWMQPPDMSPQEEARMLADATAVIAAYSEKRRQEAGRHVVEPVSASVHKTEDDLIIDLPEKDQGQSNRSR